MFYLKGDSTVHSETKKPIIDALREADYFLLARYFGYSEAARERPGSNFEDRIRKVVQAHHCCSACLQYLSVNDPPFNNTFYTNHIRVIEHVDEEIAFENEREGDSSSMEALRDKLYHSVRQF